MLRIDKQRIENYYNEAYSSDEEKYLGNVFTQESSIEELKTVLREQWDKVLPDDSDSHQLNHILYKINYQINSSEQKHTKLFTVRLVTWYARIAAILLIPILVYTGIVTYQQQRISEVNTAGWVEMSAPLGSRIKFKLPDGSIGWLNSGSALKYALNFGEIREVQLSGQAFFDVKHKEGSRFIVKTKYLDVEVKGTAFDIAAYADEKDVNVTLERGNILLKSASLSVPIEMNPDEQVNYDFAKQLITKTKVTAQIFSAWKDGKLMLRNASLEELAKHLSRWYNIDVSIENANHIDLRFRATFEDENLEEVLRLLKISSQLDFKIDERMKQSDGSFSKQKVTLKVK